MSKLYVKDFMFLNACKGGDHMKLESRYIGLRERMPAVQDGDTIETTIGEIADHMDCTRRNAVLVLGKMQRQGWLEWRPIRGRGNKSSLTFHAKTEEVIIRLAQDLVEKKDLRGALAQLNVMQVPASLKDHFHHWLTGQFGPQSEWQNNKRIDILRFPLTSPIHTLDPLHMNFTAEAHLAGQIFDSLVRLNSREQTVEPHLAHAWEVDASRTTWTFHLRKGVLFHHGREMTADDVVFSLLRLKHAEHRLLYRWAYAQISKVYAIDPITVRIELESPNELFLPFLSTNRVSIVPQDICTDNRDTFGGAPVGTGPFRLTRHDDSMSVLEAFPSYFQGRAHLDRVELWHLPELKPGLHAGTAADTFQIIHNYRLPGEPSGQWSQLEQHGASCKFITFNLLKQGPLLNDAVRAAVHDAIQSQQLVRTAQAHPALLSDLEAIQPASRFRGAVATAASPAEIGASAETLRERLRQAGYRGEALRLCTIPQYSQDARLVQHIAQEAGIQIEVMLLTAEEFKGERRLQADLLLFSLLLDSDLELRLIDLYNSMLHHLRPDVKHQVADRIKEVLSEPSKPQRTALLSEIEDVLQENSLLTVLYRKQVKTLYHSSVKGISFDSLGWVQFKNIWFSLPEVPPSKLS